MHDGALAITAPFQSFYNSCSTKMWGISPPNIPLVISLSFLFVFVFSTHSCGSELEGFRDNEAGALSVEFSTDGAVGDCGFFLFAMCFDPLTLNEAVPYIHT